MVRQILRPIRHEADANPGIDRDPLARRRAIHGFTRAINSGAMADAARQSRSGTRPAAAFPWRLCASFRLGLDFRRQRDWVFRKPQVVPSAKHADTPPDYKTAIKHPVGSVWSAHNDLRTVGFHWPTTHVSLGFSWIVLIDLFSRPSVRQATRPQTGCAIRDDRTRHDAIA